MRTCCQTPWPRQQMNCSISTVSWLSSTTVSPDNIIKWGCTQKVIYPTFDQLLKILFKKVTPVRNLWPAPDRTCQDVCPRPTSNSSLPSKLFPPAPQMQAKQGKACQHENVSCLGNLVEGCKTLARSNPEKNITFAMIGVNQSPLYSLTKPLLWIWKLFLSFQKTYNEKILFR